MKLKNLNFRASGSLLGIDAGAPRFYVGGVARPGDVELRS
jgi:hypothetical protein